MSWSLNLPCSSCKKVDKCVDPTIFGEAVNLSHLLGCQKGHLGSGSVTVQCNLHEAQEK